MNMGWHKSFCRAFFKKRAGLDRVQRVLQLQQRGSHSEVDGQGDGVSDGGEQRACHDGGIKAQLTCQNGQTAAQKLGNHYGYE